MDIRRLVVGAAVLAAFATPLAAGVASASPPGIQQFITFGFGSTADAAKADAANNMAHTLALNHYACDQVTLGVPVESGGTWEARQVDSGCFRV